jgi:hypothetical protein
MKRTQVTKLASIAATVMSAVLGLLFLIVFLAGARIQAAPLHDENAGADPRFQAVTVTSNLAIFDTHSGESISKTIYFSNSVPGAITVTFDISGTATLTLTAGAAFDEPERTYTSTNQTWSQAITYSVAITHTAQPHIVYTAINTSSEQATVAITYVQDITAPTVSIVEPSTGCFTGTQLIITGTAQDNEGGSGLKRVRVTTGATWMTVTVFNTFWDYTWTLPVADSVVYTLSARAKDLLDTVSVAATRVITVDTVAPAAAVPIPDRSPWVTSTVIYDWPDSDDGAGVAGYHMSITNAVGYSIVSVTVDSVLTFTQALTEGAGYYARVRAIDANGNVGDWSIPSTVITPDLTSPVVNYGTPPIDADDEFYVVGPTVYYKSAETSNFFVIQGTTTDTLSGVGAVDGTPALGTPKPSNIGSSLEDWAFAYMVPPGETASGQITVTAYDNAGLTAARVFTYVHDSLAPTGAITIQDDVKYVTVPTVTLAISASDNLTGCGVAQMCISDEPACTAWEPYTTTRNRVLGDEGERAVHIRYRDHVHNTSAIFSDTVFLDSVSPVITVTAPPQTTELAFTVSWEVFDPLPGSGVASYTVSYREDEGVWATWLPSTTLTRATFTNSVRDHTYAFSVTAHDLAGNSGAGAATTQVEYYRIYLPLVARNYPPQPVGSVDIEGGAVTVYQRSVTLSLSAVVAGDTVEQMCVSNSPDCHDWIAFTEQSDWALADGLSGLRAVYVQFRGSKGGVSEPVSDQIYLFLNGGFESGDFASWQRGGELAQFVEPDQPHTDAYSALLGDPSYPNKNVPEGSAWVYQNVEVPNTGAPTLNFWYRIFTYDVMWSEFHQCYYDYFDVYIQDVSGQTLSRILRDGYTGVWEPDTLQDLGWRYFEYDLSAYAGQTIRIQFASFNTPGETEDPGLNTYTYLDDVAIVGDWQ